MALPQAATVLYHGQAARILRLQELPGTKHAMAWAVPQVPRGGCGHLVPGVSPLSVVFSALRA